MTQHDFEEKLSNQFFSDLEERGIQTTEFEDLGEGYSQECIKDEFILPNDDMAKELGYEDFADYIQKQLKEQGITQSDSVKEWTRDMLKDQRKEVDTDTEYGVVTITDKKPEVVVL